MRNLIMLLFFPVFLSAGSIPLELWFDENSGANTANQGDADVTFCIFRETAVTGDGLSTGPIWSDSVAFDYSGNHSLYFHGENDNILIGSGTAAGLVLQDFSVEAWIKPEHKTTAIHQYILLGRNMSSNIRFAFRITKGEIGWRLLGVLYDLAGAATIISSEDGSIRMNEWQHVAMAYDRAVGVKLYLDGVEVASAEAFGDMADLSGEWIVSHTTTLAFKGWMDDLRVSDFARIPGDGSGTGNTLAWDRPLFRMAPKFCTETDILDFGSVSVGETALDSFVVMNGGSTELTISAVQSSVDQFSVATAPVALQPGQANAFPVSFTPDSGGEIRGKLIFTHNADSSPDSIDVFGYGTAAIDTTGKIVTKNMSWGTVVFYQGFPRSLRLEHGSREDLLPGLMDDRGFGGVEYHEGDDIFTTADDYQMQSSSQEDTVIFSGTLRDSQSSLPANVVSYELKWTVDPSGFLKVDVRLESEEPIEPGSISYHFPFNGTRLNRYYYTGFEPNAIRTSSSLKQEPMFEIDNLGRVFRFADYALGRIFGFVRSETECLNICVGSGFIADAELNNFPPTILSYTDSTPVSQANVRASFYMLPAPTRKINTLKRVYTSVTRPTDLAGTVEAFADTLEKYGIREYIYLHRWRTWNFSDATTEVSWVQSDPYLDELITELHARGIEISLYINLLPEEHATIWYQNHNGAQYATEHPFNTRRDIMDLNSPFYEHRLRDLDYVIDTLGCDGVYIDWYTLLGCTELHPYHPDMPATNVGQLIDMIKYVHAKDKIISIHSGEEGRIPFIEELSDYVVCGERNWSRTTYSSIESGVNDRWTRNRGFYNLIVDSRYGYSEAQNREEINAALLEGLNPFGWAYRAQLYGIPGSVTATEFHDQYVFTLLSQLRPYNVESLEIFTDNEDPVLATDPLVGATAMAGQDTLLLFVVNKDDSDPIQTTLTLNPGVLSIDPGRNYGILDVATGTELEKCPGRDLTDSGFSVTIPANTCKIIYIGDITQSSSAPEPAQPDRFSLAQNYPNPFNPVTMISYHVPRAERVIIGVYNLRGERITELVDAQKDPGSYTLRFDASRLASGVYFYRMEAGDWQQTRKLLLLK